LPRFARGGEGPPRSRTPSADNTSGRETSLYGTSRLFTPTGQRGGAGGDAFPAGDDSAFGHQSPTRSVTTSGFEYEVRPVAASPSSHPGSEHKGDARSPSPFVARVLREFEVRAAAVMQYPSATLATARKPGRNGGLGVGTPASPAQWAASLRAGTQRVDTGALLSAAKEKAGLGAGATSSGRERFVMFPDGGSGEDSARARARAAAAGGQRQRSASPGGRSVGSAASGARLDPSRGQRKRGHRSMSASQSAVLGEFGLGGDVLGACGDRQLCCGRLVALFGKQQLNFSPRHPVPSPRHDACPPTPPHISCALPRLLFFVGRQL
jgi:hypothetical protein